MVAQALDQAGGVEYLSRIAETHPGPFLNLVGKVLPIQVTGAEGGPLQISWPVAPPKIEREQAVGSKRERGHGGVQRFLRAA